MGFAQGTNRRSFDLGTLSKHSEEAVIVRHPWDVSAEEAQAVQRRLASRVDRTNAIPEQSTLVAGVDMSPPDANGLAVGAVALLACRTWRLWR